MKSVVFFIATLLVISSCDAQRRTKKEVKRTYHNNGKVFTETEMLNGKKNGEERIYHDNGNIMYKQYFKDDMLVDSFYQYSKEKPNEIEIVGYVTPISRFTALDYPSLKIIGVSDYKVNQIGEGLVKTYYENGKVTSVSEHKNGKADGIYILYYPDGNIKSIRHKKAGELIPPIIEFDSTGKVIKYVRVGD